VGSNPAAPTITPRRNPVTSQISAATVPRFLPLFFVALGVRVGTVALGSALWTLPPNVIPPDEPSTVEIRERILNGCARVVEPWFRWDAVWMTNVSLHGYAGATDRGGRLGVAFTPAMPATLALGEALGLNMFWFGLVAANLAGAAGAALLAQVAARQLNDPAAGWRTLALLLAFPTAFFYSAPYNESFGLLFTAIALAAWQANRPVLAGLGALGGSLARMTGVALGVAAILDWLVKRERRELWRAVAVASGSFAGLALFWGFLWWAVGDPFAGLKSQVMWGRSALSWKNPFRTVASIYDPALPHWGEAVLVLGAAVLGVRAWWKRGTFWGVLTLVPVAQMFASGTLLSGHRLILAALPAFLELADLLRNRRALFFATLLGFAFAQFLLLNRYVHWMFAG
jgi:hypothetical protein